VNHSDARAAISERMDGELLSARRSSALDRHLSTCTTCRAFESGAWRLRETVRFGVAEPVPDLVSTIMRGVRAEAATRPPRLTVLRRGRAPRPAGSRALAPVAAALLVGFVAGSLTVGGPWRTDRPSSLASASDVSAGVAAAASALSAYQATFEMSETDPTGQPTRRQLTMSVRFVAPERFRLDVTDQTPGAGTRFAADDLQLIVNGGSSYQVTPSACPIGVCPEREQVVRNRLPFSSATPAPTDLILPVSTLVDAREMRVVGGGRVLGRDAVEVRLPFERARPLFPFLDLGGRWRSFYPHDRVDLWLDARSWFPLKYTVYPAAGPGRDEWQLRFGLPDEAPDVPIFEVDAVSVDPSVPDASTFRIPHARTSTDEGGRVVTIADVRDAVMFDPLVPRQVDGLELYRVVLPEGERDDAVLTYASGLSWLKLGEASATSGEAFFGPLGHEAEQVEVPGVGAAYYEPASAGHGRRLAIHTERGDLYLETNLSRERLLQAAASLRVRAASIPTSWLTTSSSLGKTRRVSLDEAARELPFTILVPAPAPSGYRLASAEIVSLRGRSSLNVYFAREDGPFDADPLRLHEESARRLPPASAARQYAVPVVGVEGRWTPGRDRLEWVSDDVYHSLDSESLPLDELLRVASSMAEYAVGDESGLGSEGPIPSPSAFP
jgi:outer membrane lipoprotein-sorting protein